jgi:hypothetical protein
MRETYRNVVQSLILRATNCILEMDFDPNTTETSSFTYARTRTLVWYFDKFKVNEDV